MEEAASLPDPTGQASPAATLVVSAPAVAADQDDAEPEEEELGEASPCSADMLPKKRKGKSTRWNIPKHALTTLEQVFTRDKFPTVDTRKNLASELKVTPRQVQVWFQNKRQRSLKPPVKAGSTEQQQPPQILSTSEDIKAALINFGSNQVVDPTRAQREVFAEDGMRESLSKLAGSQSAGGMASTSDWMAAASAQAGSSSVSGLPFPQSSSGAPVSASLGQGGNLSNWWCHGSLPPSFPQSSLRRGGQWPSFLSGSSGSNNKESCSSSGSNIPSDLVMMAGLPPSLAAHFLPLSNNVSSQALAQLASSGTSLAKEFSQQHAGKDGGGDQSSQLSSQLEGGSRRLPSGVAGSEGARELMLGDCSSSLSSLMGSASGDSYALPPSMPTGRSLNASQALEGGGHGLGGTTNLVSEAVLAAAAAANTPMPSMSPTSAANSLPDGVPAVLAQQWQQMLMMQRHSNWQQSHSSMHDGPGASSHGGEAGSISSCGPGCHGIRRESSQTLGSNSSPPGVGSSAGQPGGSLGAMPTGGGPWQTREQMLMQELMSANVVSCAQSSQAYPPMQQTGDDLMEELIDSLFTDEMSNPLCQHRLNQPSERMAQPGGPRMKLPQPGAQRLAGGAQLRAGSFSPPDTSPRSSSENVNQPGSGMPTTQSPPPQEQPTHSSSSSPSSRCSESRLSTHDLLQMGVDLLEES